jgi:tetratricopeptide (TPR) repeat protein
VGAQAPPGGASDEAPDAPEVSSSSEGSDPVPREETEARHHFESGRAHYQRGRFTDAAREFERAYELFRNPSLIYNAYLAFRDLGDVAGAHRTLARYLDEARDVPTRELLEGRLAALRAQLEDPPADETATDREVPRASHSSPAEEGTAWGPWILLGAGGATLVAAGVTGVLAMTARNRASDDYCGGGTACRSGYEEPLDDARRFATVTNVLLAVGGALAAAGVVWLALSPAEPESPVLAALTPRQGGVTLDVDVRF